MTDKKKPERTFVYTLARIVAWILTHTIFPLRVRGRENLPEQSPYIIMANHKSLIDPIAVAYAVRDYEVRFLGKKELVKTGFGRWLLRHLHMIELGRHETDMGAIRRSTQALREGRVLGIFPEGTRKQPALMHEVESGVAMLALRTKVPLVPFYFDKKIKLFRLTTLTIGSPIPYEDLMAQPLNKQTMDALTERVKERFYLMRDEAEARLVKK